MDSRQNHDGRRDPTGSGQNQEERLSLPLIRKRSKFRRPRPRRFVETEREIESNRPSTQQDERAQATTGATPSASLHLSSLTVTAIRARDTASPVRHTNSSPNRLTLPPIDTNRVPTPRPPQTPSSNSTRQASLRARYNVSDGHATAPSPSPTPQPQHCNILTLEIALSSSGHNSRAASRNSARANRDANSASRNANSASRDSNSDSRNANSAGRSNGGNISRQSGLLGNSSARSRDHAPSKCSMRTSSGQPVPSTAPYQHQGSNSDGALIITGIHAAIKPAPPSGRVCNSNTLRRHSTGGKMVPKHEKTNDGLIVPDKSFLKPKPPEEPKSRPPSSQRRPSRTSLKSKRSSNHQKSISQADDDYPPDFEPLSEEEEVKAANNSRAPSSKAVSRPPSSIPEEIEEEGRYDYSDDKFEVYEEEERPPAGSRPNSEASIPEELPGQSKPYIYQDDDIPPETDIPEEIVTSDDDEDDDSRPASRC